MVKTLKNSQVVQVEVIFFLKEPSSVKMGESGSALGATPLSAVAIPSFIPPDERMRNPKNLDE